MEDANCGRLVDPKNPQEIAKAIDELLKNPKELKKLSINARKAFKNKYNWSYERQKLINVYNILFTNIKSISK